MVNLKAQWQNMGHHHFYYVGEDSRANWRAELETGLLRPDNRSKQTSLAIGGLEHADMHLSNPQTSPNPLLNGVVQIHGCFHVKLLLFLGKNSMIAGLLPSEVSCLFCGLQTTGFKTLERTYSLISQWLPFSTWLESRPLGALSCCWPLEEGGAPGWWWSQNWDEVHVGEDAKHTGPLLWTTKGPEKGERQLPTGTKGVVGLLRKDGLDRGEATTLSSHKFFDPVLGFFAGAPDVLRPPHFAGITRVEETGREWCKS